MNKGKKLDSFAYEKITLMYHYTRVLVLNVPCLLMLIIGEKQGAPNSWLSIVLSAFIWFNLHWFSRWRKENGFPTFTLYDGGIDIHYPLKKNHCWYEWTSLSKVRLVSPFERTSRGMLEFLEGRPGFELIFEDEQKVMVYQRIQGYSTFYQCLADRNIKGVQEKLPFYDRLSVYGQSLDGEMGSFNNYGEPSGYQDIKVQTQGGRSD